jgi:hypothetical protein
VLNWKDFWRSPVRTLGPTSKIIFDDTIEHEAWNNSNQDRVVLTFDVWRPELTEQERAELTAPFRTERELVKRP